MEKGILLKGLVGIKKSDINRFFLGVLLVNLSERGFPDN